MASTTTVGVRSPATDKVGCSSEETFVFEDLQRISGRLEGPGGAAVVQSLQRGVVLGVPSRST